MGIKKKKPSKAFMKENREWDQFGGLECQSMGFSVPQKLLESIKRKVEDWTEPIKGVFTTLGI